MRAAWRMRCRRSWPARATTPTPSTARRSTPTRPAARRGRSPPLSTSPANGRRQGEADMAKRIGFLISHPIQYYAPIFRELARRCELTVFFAHRQTAEQQARAGFGVAFEWDIDLLSGYRSQ